MEAAAPVPRILAQAECAAGVACRLPQVDATRKCLFCRVPLHQICGYRHGDIFDDGSPAVICRDCHRRTPQQQAAAAAHAATQAPNASTGGGNNNNNNNNNNGMSTNGMNNPFLHAVNGSGMATGTKRTFGAGNVTTAGGQGTAGLSGMQQAQQPPNKRMTTPASLMAASAGGQSPGTLMDEQQQQQLQQQQQQQENEQGWSSKQRRPLFIPGYGDITTVHDSWRGRCTVPDAAKIALWWNAFHCFHPPGVDPNDPSKARVCCNICGKDFALCGSGTSPLIRHLERDHMPVHNFLKEKAQNASQERKNIFVTTTTDRTGAVVPATAEDYSNAGTTPATKSSTRTSQLLNRKRPPFVIDGVGDLTLVHESWRGYCYEPEDSKMAIWWNVYHCFLDHQKRHRVCCNLCGKDFAQSGCTTTPLSRHLERDHYKVFQYLTNKSSQATSATSPAPSGASKSMTMADAAMKKADVLSPGTGSASLAFLRSKTKKDLEDEALDANAFYLAATNLLHSHVDLPVFERLLEASVAVGRKGGRFQFTAEQVQQRIYDLALNSREALKERLQGKQVIASTSHWSSRSQENQVSLILHWIEDFQLHSSVVSVHMFHGTNCPENIAEQFYKELQRWGLDLAQKQVPIVVTDLQPETAKFGNKVEEDHGVSYLYCIDHLLQFVAAIAFEAKIELQPNNDQNDETGVLDSEEANESAQTTTVEAILGSTVRGVVDYFAKSTLAMNKLMEVQVNLDPKTTVQQFSQDLVPRWWSSLAMLDSLCAMRKAVEAYAEKYGFPAGVRLPTEQEWEVLQELQTLLDPFRTASDSLRENKFVTSSNILFILKVIQDDLVSMVEEPGSNLRLEDTVRKLLVRLEEMFGSLAKPYSNSIEHGSPGLQRAVLFAHVLDPRYKSLAIIDDASNRTQLWDGLLQAMVDAGQPSDDKSKNELNTDTSEGVDSAGRGMEGDGTAASIESQEGAARKASKRGRDRSAAFSKYARLLSGAGAEPVDQAASNQREWRLICDAELTAYRSEPAISLAENEDPLVWWKERYQRFPTLWRLAQIYLAVPATSARPDRAMSIAGSLATRKECLEKEIHARSSDAMFLNENQWLLDSVKPSSAQMTMV